MLIIMCLFVYGQNTKYYYSSESLLVTPGLLQKIVKKKCNIPGKFPVLVFF